jgi:ubiquinone/menaquinone biosynthesis C-methylase UbiE
MQAAQRWERASAEMGKHVTNALVEYADPQPGERVLDVACGTGAPSLKVARRVGASGSVLATDCSEEADVHALPYGEDEFDLVTCRFGVMFFADLPRALREMLRVLKPGGRTAFAAWGAFHQPYFQATAGVVLRHTGATLPPNAALMFKFGERGSLARELAAAGFAGPRDEIHTVPWVWTESVAELWAYFQAVTVPLRPVLEGAKGRPEIEREVLAELGKYADGEKVNLTAEIVLAGGRKP